MPPPKHSGKLTPCHAAAVQGDYWRRAARDLARRPRPPAKRKRPASCIHSSRFRRPAGQPHRCARFTADARAVNRFFYAPGNLIGTRRYCSWAQLTAQARATTIDRRRERSSTPRPSIRCCVRRGGSPRRRRRCAFADAAAHSALACDPHPRRPRAWIGGIGLMDPSLRRRLGIGWSGVDQAQFQAMGAGVSRTHAGHAETLAGDRPRAAALAPGRDRRGAARGRLIPPRVGPPRVPSSGRRSSRSGPRRRRPRRRKA